MFKNLLEVNRYIKNNDISMVDLKYADLFGRWHHITVPVNKFEDAYNNGVAFDSSSVGFKSVEAGDMVLIPDITTGFLDVFCEIPTLSFICSICEADTREGFSGDPRSVAIRAEKYLKSTGIADESLWSPEFEYYVFDSINYKNDMNLSYYAIDCEEAEWNSGKNDFNDLGYKIPFHKGYHAIPPLDTLQDLRSETVEIIQKAGIPVRYHHHEGGGPGQSEIEILFHTLTRAADVTMLVKYIIKMTAYQYEKTVTFMPKPLYGEAGNGMHFHQHLFKRKQPLFYDKKGYAGLSKLALHYIGGILMHAPALTAFTNPSTNSFKRLIPGFEAPVNLFFSLANRSAAIRIPKYATSPKEKRIEYRPPDATCNIYLALSAILMAGIDGIKKKIDPTEHGFGPFDEDIMKMDEKKKSKIKPLPVSLKKALEALEADYEFLLQGKVFDKDMIDRWIDHKLKKEFNEVRNRPHPYEMFLYYDC